MNTSIYPPDCEAVFNAVKSATGQALLISECQDIISSLEKNGFIYTANRLFGTKSKRSLAMRKYWERRKKQEAEYEQRKIR